MKNVHQLIFFILLMIGCVTAPALAQDANIRVRGVGVDIWNVNGETPSPRQMIYPIGIPRKWEERSDYSTLGERHFWTERPVIVANKDYATTPRPEAYGRSGCRLDAISADKATTLLIAVPLPTMNAPGWTRVPGAFRTSLQTLYTYTYDYTTPGEWVDIPYFDENVPTLVFAEEGKLVFDNPLPLSDLAEGVLIEDKMIPYNRENPSTRSFYSFDPHFVILANGDYVAGRNGARFISRDKGTTWSRLGSYNVDHASTFYHNGDLYIIGDEKGLSNLESVITRSTDGGRTWSTPVKLGFNGRNSPSSVEVGNGRLWLAMEDASSAVVKIASAPVSSDLLDPDSWSLTERPDTPRSVPNDDSEPCMAMSRDGYPIAFSILEGPVKASSPTEATEMFPSNEFRLPSRGSKFDVRYDAVTDKYWALTSYSPIEGNIRTGMTLFSSTDLKTWQQERVVIQASSVNFHGFQYPSMQFDGDDLVFASRTAYENQWGQAQRWHDSNMLTFHRVENFRGDTPNSGTSPEGTFILKNVATGQVLDANLDGVIVMGPQGATADRTWNLNATTDGYVMIDNGPTDRGPISAKPSPGNPLTWLAERYSAKPYVNREWLPIPVSGGVYKFQCRDTARGYITASASGPINQLDGNITTAHWELIATATSARQAGEPSADKSQDEQRMMETIDDQLQVYPNPSSGSINVTLGGGERADIYLYSVEGQLVVQKEYTGGVLRITTHPRMESGMYLLRSISESGRVTNKKILIQ